MHEPLAVQEIDSLRYLEEDVQTLVVFPLLREATLSHPVLQVLFPTELHLDVQVHLETGGRRSILLTVITNILTTETGNFFFKLELKETKTCNLYL